MSTYSFVSPSSFNQNVIWFDFKCHLVRLIYYKLRILNDLKTIFEFSQTVVMEASDEVMTPRSSIPTLTCRFRTTILSGETTLHM